MVRAFMRCIVILVLFLQTTINLGKTDAIKRSTPKKLTIMIYMAADNNLGRWAIKNLEQMMRVGSTQEVNIVVQLDIKVQGNKKITCRYNIERDNVVYLNADEVTTQKMDSGNPETLISFCTYAVRAFPAQEYGLILWNHGAGVIDPGNAKLIDTTDLFVFNPETRQFDLDRRSTFLELLESTAHQEEVDNRESMGRLFDDNRGICWDDTTGNYISNQGLEFCLAHLCKEVLHKKFAFIGFDACFMSMVEVFDIIQRYAHYTVASQEIEYAAGWQYDELFNYFLDRESIDIKEFMQHTVAVYQKRYMPITNDYTLAALDLRDFSSLTDNLHVVATLLLKSLTLQKKQNVKEVVKACGHRRSCTYFYEPTYVDLHHLYSNILTSISLFEFSNAEEAAEVQAQLMEALKEGKAIIERIVIANTAGKNLSKAKGLSIYFPTNRLHLSYSKTVFAKHNAWFELLETLVAA